MRNLLEYPITLEEMIAAVNLAILTEERGEQICGDTTLAALKEVVAMLKDKLEVQKMETRNDNDL